MEDWENMITTQRRASTNSAAVDHANNLQVKNKKALVTAKEKQHVSRGRQISAAEAHVEDLKDGSDKYERQDEKPNSVKDTNLATQALALKLSDSKLRRISLKERDKDRWSRMEKKELEAELERLGDRYEDLIMNSPAVVTRLESVADGMKEGYTATPKIGKAKIKKNDKDEVPSTVHFSADCIATMSLSENASEESKSQQLTASPASAAISETEALHGSTGHSTKYQHEIKVLMENNANLRQLVEELTLEKVSPKFETDIQQLEFMLQSHFKVQQLERENNNQLDAARRRPSEQCTADDEFDLQTGSVTELWKSLRLLQKSEKSARGQTESAFRMLLNLDTELRSKLLSLKAMREVQQQKDRDLNDSKEQVLLLTQKLLQMEAELQSTRMEPHKISTNNSSFQNVCVEQKEAVNLLSDPKIEESKITDNQSVINEVRVPVPASEVLIPSLTSSEVTPPKRLSLSKMVPPRVLGTKVAPTLSPSEKSLNARILSIKTNSPTALSNRMLATRVPDAKSPPSAISNTKVGAIKKTLTRPQSEMTINRLPAASTPSQDILDLKLLQEKLDQANNALKVSDEARSKLASDLMDADARTSMIEKSFKNLEDMLHDANDKSAESQRGFNSVKDQLLFSKQNAEGLRGQLTGSKLSAEELKDKLAISQQCSTVLMEELLVGQRNAGIMKAEQDNSQKSPEILRGELVISQQTVTALRWDLNVRQKSFEALKADLVAAQSSLATKTKELTDTEELLSKAKVDLVCAVRVHMVFASVQITYSTLHQIKNIQKKNVLR